MNYTIESYLERYLLQNDILYKLVNKICEKGDIVSYGGFVRSYLEKKDVELIRDLDLVILSQKGLEFWHHFFEDYNYYTNSMGGFKIKIDRFIIDFWELNSTWAFREKIYKPSVENLEKTVFLNIDGAVYDFKKKKMYNKFYLNAIHQKCLDVVLKDNPLIELNFARSLYFTKQYNLTFSEELSLTFKKYFLKNSSIDSAVKNIINAQDKHYGERVNSAHEIRAALRRICY